jgi:hypothetical protein
MQVLFIGGTSIRDDEDVVIAVKRVPHGAIHTTIGCESGDDQRVDTMRPQPRVEVRADEAGVERFFNFDVSASRLDTIIVRPRCARATDRQPSGGSPMRRRKFLSAWESVSGRVTTRAKANVAPAFRAAVISAWIRSRGASRAPRSTPAWPMTPAGETKSTCTSTIRSAVRDGAMAFAKCRASPANLPVASSAGMWTRQTPRDFEAAPAIRGRTIIYDVEVWLCVCLGRYSGAKSCGADHWPRLAQLAHRGLCVHALAFEKADCVLRASLRKTGPSNKLLCAATQERRFRAI